MNLKKSADMLAALIPIARESVLCEAAEVEVDRFLKVSGASVSGASSMMFPGIDVPSGKYTMIVALVPIEKKK